MTLTTDMTLERETKGAVRYAEDQSDPLYLLGTLYLRKAALAAQDKDLAEKGWPKRIRVTVELMDD